MALRFETAAGVDHVLASVLVQCVRGCKKEILRITHCVIAAFDELVCLPGLTQTESIVGEKLRTVAVRERKSHSRPGRTNLVR